MYDADGLPTCCASVKLLMFIANESYLLTLIGQYNG